MLELKRVVLAIVVLTVLLGIIYPLTVWGLGQLIFPAKANGSLIYFNNKPIGSELISRRFSGPGYFHPRPSAAGQGYDASASGGSNLGPLSKTLLEQVNQRVRDYREENQLASDIRVPVDAVTASGSGLDPHISIENVVLQAARVAKTRHIDLEQVKAVIEHCTENRQLGILGETRVNVLLLNVEIEKLR
ncbi:MAG: potassium-transporting ATPase KdpC subunit [Acidobacteriota bacterium]|nr:potassium-transporting ATPase KdpC subunit [Acidobacteriota bacterium]